MLLLKLRTVCYCKKNLSIIFTMDILFISKLYMYSRKSISWLSAHAQTEDNYQFWSDHLGKFDKWCKEFLHPNSLSQCTFMTLKTCTHSFNYTRNYVIDTNKLHRIAQCLKSTIPWQIQLPLHKRDNKRSTNHETVPHFVSN